MAKALFLGLPLHGHTNPSLPLVRELVGRGEAVVYYSADPFAARIEQTGARYRPYRNAFLADITRLPERMDELSWLLMQTTADILDRELDAFRADRPDYVIADSVAPWGQWVGEVLGVPVVTSVSTFAFNRHVLAFAASHGVRPKSAKLLLSKLRHMYKALRLGRRLSRKYGVAGPGITGLVLGGSALNIVYTSRHFQPCAGTFDDRFQFVGPSLTLAGTSDGRDEQARRAAVVYVSLGTLFNADAAFYRACFEAFGREDIEVILSIGTNVSEASLGQAPANFVVRPHVPQLEVLARASAFVTHGGMNSVSESLFQGVPVVVIPQMGEQEVVGRRVEEIGAGIYLAKHDVSAEKLRASVARLLTDSRFREQAAVVRESFRTAGGVARAAEAILAFTRPAVSRATVASGRIGHV
jgi:MGT family glycosyltransferase